MSKSKTEKEKNDNKCIYVHAHVNVFFQVLKVLHTYNTYRNTSKRQIEKIRQ